MWQRSPIGRDAFWRVLDAMVAAGLAGDKGGIQTPAPFSGSGFDGRPSCVWPAPELLALAARHGVTCRSVGDDWPVSKAAEMVRPGVAYEGLVVCRSLAIGGPIVVLTAKQEAIAEQMRKSVGQINDAAAGAEIRGCIAPAFVRRFIGDLRLGGRLYALGANHVQTLGPAERGAITIGGETVSELDIHASQLSVFLALTGTRELPDLDLYAIGGLPRAAVKAWIVQTLGKGSLVKRWADNTPEAVRAVKAATVKSAVLTAYPAFQRSLRAILPPDLMGVIPEERLDWAVGQYLTFRESAVLSSAMGYVLAMTAGPVIPIHDSLIVPRGAAGIAKRALEEAFRTLLDLTPRVV